MQTARSTSRSSHAASRCAKTRIVVRLGWDAHRRAAREGTTAAGLPMGVWRCEPSTVREDLCVVLCCVCVFVCVSDSTRECKLDVCVCMCVCVRACVRACVVCGVWCAGTTEAVRRSPRGSGGGGARSEGSPAEPTAPIREGRSSRQPSGSLVREICPSLSQILTTGIDRWGTPPPVAVVPPHHTDAPCRWVVQSAASPALGSRDQVVEEVLH